ncbi:hypothetical protein BCR39DRAFT_508314 [Naematelia encephala]|uniref:Uncharacterized protein n=1 Tax=Naematelia encephala TaxID=71784 RepID=A0A1Y2AGF5_9TREE|nr:hypothetical protein BCR39DRAFT_508314 [Naematelia encephala]
MTRKPGKHGGKRVHKKRSPNQSKEPMFAKYKISQWHSTLPVALQLHYNTAKVVNHKQNYDHIAEYLYNQLALHNSKQLQPPPGDFSIAHASPPVGQPKYLIICLWSWYPPQCNTSRKIMKALDECYDSPQTKKDGQNPDFHLNHFGIWAGYSKSIFASAYTMFHQTLAKQTPTNMKKADELLKEAVCGNIRHKVKPLDPETFVRMLGINHKLSQASANNSGPPKHKDLTEHGRLLSIGFNSMVAVPEGPTANWHYDKEDSKEYYTLHMVLSDRTW